MTRDRITGLAHLSEERAFQLIDTGGLMLAEDDPLGLSTQVFLAVEESDLLLLVVDGRQGLVSADEVVWERFRRYGKPTILVVNKGDTREARDRFSEFYGLGIDQQIDAMPRFEASHKGNHGRTIQVVACMHCFAPSSTDYSMNF